MSTPVRIYEVTELGDSPTSRLIKATTPAQAVRYVANKSYDVNVADPMRVAQLFQEGLVSQVEDASKTA